jgi:multicomponent Na+:H+ antiporter subunit A
VYVSITLLFAILLVGFTLVTRSGHLLAALPSPDLQLHEAILGAVMIAAAFGAVRAETRLAAITALGVVGTGVALLFVFYGAPDLALTQFAIETLTVLLFVLVLYRLPRFSRISTRRTRVRDAALATAGGTLMAALTLAAASQIFRSDLAGYYGDTSLLLAKGRNVVNVILVDFRGLDTLGEITVLAAAALGVFALLRLRTGREDRR